MTDLAAEFSIRPLAGLTLRDDFVQLLRNALARRRDRRLMIQLARCNPRLVADMGFDPKKVRAAAEGSWDEFRPELMLRSAPWL